MKHLQIVICLGLMACCFMVGRLDGFRKGSQKGYSEGYLIGANAAEEAYRNVLMGQTQTVGIRLESISPGEIQACETCGAMLIREGWSFFESKK